jgi:hypothetical protein
MGQRSEAEEDKAFNARSKWISSHGIVQNA